MLMLSLSFRVQVFRSQEKATDAWEQQLEQTTSRSLWIEEVDHLSRIADSQPHDVAWLANGHS